MTAKHTPARAALLAHQMAWMRALLNPEAQASLPWATWRPGVRDVGQAGAVYVNNVRANVINALMHTFPATTRWLGDRRFKQLMVNALVTHPPAGGDLSIHGDWLSGWLSSLNDADDLRHAAWLSDIEWALEQARCTPRDKAWLWSQAATDLQLPHWTGALTRLCQPWRSWTLAPDRLEVLQHCAARFQTEQPVSAAARTPQPITLLLQGRRLHLINAPDWYWLSCLDSGSNLALACEKTASVWPAWTPDSILKSALTQGLLTPLRFIPRPPLTGQP